jgi:hypothetical protein
MGCLSLNCHASAGIPSGMTTLIMRSAVISLVLTLAVAVSSAAARPAAASQVGASRTALAIVLDPRNRPILDISADDFVIQEAGAAREILSVRPADYPIVLALDTSSDARGEFDLMRSAAAHFIERIGQRPIAIVTFGGAPQLVAGFDDDRETVLARLSTLTADTNAASALLQGAALGAETIRENGLLYGSMVILSSATVDGSQGSPNEMLASIVESNAIVHVIAKGSDLDRVPFRAIRTAAEQSRGDFTPIYSAASFQAALDRLAEHLTSELLVEYLVPVGSTPKDVKLGVRILGAHVRGLGVAPK